MATNKEKLIEDIMLMLGGGMVDVDLDPGHYEIAIRMAIDRYRLRSSNSFAEMFVLLTTQSGKDTYYLPEDIQIVRSVYRSGSIMGAGGSGGFDPYELMLMNNLYGIQGAGLSGSCANTGSSGNLVSYDMAMQQQELMSRMFRKELIFTWEESMHRLQFHRTFNSSEQLLLRVYSKKPDETLLRDTYAVSWIRDYSIAKCKMMLGEARSKFQSLAGPNGGITLNGDTLKQEAVAEFERLEAELKSLIDQREGYGMVIG